LVFFAVNGYWLHTRGQSVGKRLLGIRIMRSSGERATLSRIIFARYLPTQAVGIVPVIGMLYALIDILVHLPRFASMPARYDRRYHRGQGLTAPTRARPRSR
jgi:uncharacterized RDD family membrane protein YckC